MEQTTQSSESFFNDSEAVKSNFQQIADLKTRIAEMTAELKRKEGIGLAYIKFKEKEIGDKVSVDLPFGKFIAMSRTTYLYSANVKAFEDQVKTLKKTEEEQGVAKVKTFTQYIKFSPAKE